MLQDLTFETAHLESFETMLATAHAMFGCTHLFRLPPDLRWEYPSYAAAYLMSFLGQAPVDVARWKPPDERPAPFYRPICLLSYQRSPSGYEEAIPVTDRADVLRKAIELVRAADRDAFEAETGEGPFRGCDGTVGIGYRLHGGSLRSRGSLHVSLCHIYYPK